MLNKNFAYASDETFRGWNEREDGCLALFHGKGDIWISDGNQIIDKKTFDLIYYFADIYLLVRENEHLMMYNTNFEVLEDYGEISLSNKFHFDETIREGKKRNLSRSTLTRARSAMTRRRRKRKILPETLDISRNMC